MKMIQKLKILQNSKDINKLATLTAILIQESFPFYIGLVTTLVPLVKKSKE